MTCVKTHFFGQSGFGCHCELEISGVEIARGHASSKTQAQRAAYNAFVELMKKPYLCVQEVPELNYSYKLTGSDQPFVGVTAGILPYEQNCVVSDEGKIIEEKQSAELGEIIDSDQWHSPDVTYASDKLKIEASFAESLNSSQAASAMPEDLCETQNCVVSDKGKIIVEKQSAEQGKIIDSHQWHSSDVTYDSGKIKLEEGFSESLNSSQAATAMPEDLCETHVSAVTYGMRVSELQNQFHALAHRVKSISKSSLEVHNSTDIIDTALADTQMQKKRLIAWLSSIACRCELSVDGVVLSYGAGDTREQAKEAAYDAAFELLSKPHLQLQGNSEFKQSYRLVGCEEPFVASPHVLPTEPLRTFVATDKRPCREKHPPGYLKMSKESACATENAFCSQQRVETFPAHSLAKFVILRNHFRKAHKATIDILQQSASFNKWPLTYDLTTVQEGLRCVLTLRGHILADVVGEGKKSAKKAAAEQALKKLSSACYTIKVKKCDIVAKALTRNEVWIIII